jgi:hypothetical protein
MTEANHSPDKDNGTRGGYPHGTIGANKSLAREESDEVIENNCPDVIRSGLYILTAFGNAWGLFVECRTDKPKWLSKEQFMAKYVRLDVNLGQAEKLRGKNTEFFYGWPEDPGIIFGPYSDWCALGVAHKFSRRVLDTILIARAIGLGE